MKQINIFAVLIMAVVLLFSGCNSSFLEEDPNGYISTDQLQKNATWNPNIMLGQALGTYSTTFAWQSGGTTQHDDFGQKSVDIATDLMSGDMAMSGETYGWFSTDAKLNNTSPTRDRTYMIWRYYYRIIKACNEIFDTIGDDETLPEDVTNQIYYAQAKAMRSHSYFNLVSLYAKNYDVAANEPAIPLYRSQLTAETKGLSKVEEVYKLIIEDLNEAIEILEETGFTPPSGTKDQIDQWTAKGILGYVYLSKGEYEEAARVSQDVIDNSPYRLMTASELMNSGFSSVDIASWMWAFDITKDNTAGLPTFWGHVDLFTYSYCSAGDYKMIDSNLYAEIPETDLRKSWFRPTDPMLSWNKFYDSKRIQMGDRNWTNDIVYLRLEEIYLINAEANARINKLPEARTTLTTFLSDRDTDAIALVNVMTQSDLLEEIYFNWRVEMWAEGRGLMTLKRFKKNVMIGDNNYARKGETLSYDDSRLIFQIPEREVSNNPNLQK